VKVKKERKRGKKRIPGNNPFVVSARFRDDADIALAK